MKSTPDYTGKNYKARTKYVKEGIKKIEVSDDFKWIIVAYRGIVRIWSSRHSKVSTTQWEE